MRLIRALCVLTLIPGAAIASPVTWRVTGSVYNAPENSGGGLPAGILVGDSVLLDYTFETTTADQAPADTTLGVYNGALTFISLNVGGGKFVANYAVESVNNIQVYDDYFNGSYYVDMYGFQGRSAAVQNGFQVDVNSGWGSSGVTLPVTPLTSDALPAAPPFADQQITWRTISLYEFANGQFVQQDSIDWMITAHTTAPVPLPAAAWLLLSGMGALGAVSRRRVSKAANAD
jgi:hypothetical protein